MKSFFRVAIFCLIFLFASKAFALVPSNVLLRVFLIQYKDSAGTCFTIEVDNRQYIITAKHVVKGIAEKDTIKLHHENQWKNLSVISAKHDNDKVDIIVLIPPIQLSTTQPLLPTSAGLYWSQEVYFVGFPYKMYQYIEKINRGFPMPFIKSGICSAMENNKEEGLSLIYVDGHNNPGFSGGPIVFQDLSTKEFKVAAVISAYLNHPDIVVKDGKETGLFAQSNAGILLGFDIKHAIEIIKKRPEGPIVETSK